MGELDFTLGADKAFAVDKKTSETLELFVLPKEEQNFSIHPTQQKWNPSQISLREKYISLLQDIVSNYHIDSYEKVSIIAAAYMLSKIFAECSQKGEAVEVGFLGEDINKFSEHLSEYVHYFHGDSHVIGIEANPLVEKRSDFLDTQLFASVTDFLKIFPEDSFSILLVDGLLWLRSRVSCRQLISKVKAGGTIFLYFSDQTKENLEGLEEFERICFFNTTIYHLSVTEQCKEQCYQTSDKFIENCKLGDFFDLYQLLKDLGKHVFAPANFPLSQDYKAAANTLIVVANNLELLLLEFYSQLTNKEIIYTANCFKVAILELALEKNEFPFYRLQKEGAGQYIKLCSEIKLEFHIS